MAKVNLKLSLDIMSKLYQTFQSPYSLRKHPSTILFHSTLLSEFVAKYSETSFLSGSSSSEILFWQKQLIPVSFYLKVSRCCCISVSQPFYHLCLLLAKKLASRNKLLSSMKTFLLLLTKPPNARNFSFFLCFMSFFRFFRFHFPV